MNHLAEREREKKKRREKKKKKRALHRIEPESTDSEGVSADTLKGPGENTADAVALRRSVS